MSGKNNCCVVCGDIIPEGRQICPKCESNSSDRLSHYTAGKTLDNAIKCITRAGGKNPSEEIKELRNAIWYINRRILEIKRNGEKWES